jgi:menaquinone-dependent protoporphyrinogen oxidase
MSASILVAYATRAGSTQEVAEAVTTTLREAGLVVDIQPLRKVDSLEGYEAVVIGAPFYMFRWHKDALGFLKRHQGALSSRPAAVFALGPYNDVEKEWNDVRAQLDKALAKFPWFAPVAVQVFGGKFDPATLRPPYSLLPGMKKLPVTDIRDWQAIAAWARELVAKFQPGGNRQNDSESA